MGATRVEPLADGGFVWVRQHVFEIVPVDVVQRDASKPLPELPQAGGIEIQRVSAGQPGRWRDLVPKARWRSVERSLARGDQGYLAAVDGDFAGRIWVSRVSHRDPWSGVRIRLAPDEAYAYAMEAVPRYRPRGVAAALLATMLSEVAAGGDVIRVYGMADSRNRKSLALLCAVFGFTRVQTVQRAHLLRRIGWQVRGSDRPSYGPVSRDGRHAERNAS